MSRIPREKLILGIPNYGYDWPLPFVPGEDPGEKPWEMWRRPGWRRRWGAEIFFDEIAQTPYFYYREDGDKACGVV